MGLGCHGHRARGSLQRLERKRQIALPLESAHVHDPYFPPRSRQSPGYDLELLELLKQMDASSPSAGPSGAPYAHPYAATGGTPSQQQASRFQPTKAEPAGPPGTLQSEERSLQLLGRPVFPGGIPSPGGGLGTWPPRDLSMDPDPQAEPLMEAGMDISGSVLFDSNLLNMIQFNHG